MNENKIPEYDPWTGDSNPLLDSEDVRKRQNKKKSLVSLVSPARMLLAMKRQPLHQKMQWK